MVTSKEHFDQGKDFLDKNNTHEATREFSEAIKLDPAFAKAYFELAMSYLLAIQYDDAIKYFSMFITMKPESPEGHCWLGVTYQSKGEYENAIKALNTALEYQPHYYLPHYYLGETYLEQGRIKESIGEFEKVIEIYPDDDCSYASLGEIYLNQKNYTEAVRCFKNSIQISPDDSNKHFKLAKTYELLGNINEAVEHYKISKKLDPENFESEFELKKIYSDKSLGNAMSYLVKILDFFVTYSKPTRLFGKVLLGLLLIIPFMILFTIIVIFLLSGISFRLIKMILGLRFKKLRNISIQFFTKMEQIIFFVFVRRIARCYYNGWISDSKAQKIIQWICKISHFQNSIETILEDEIALSLLFSRPIDAYYFCYLLNGKLISHDAQFQLQMIWVRSAILAGLQVDAEIILTNYKELVERETDIHNIIELQHYYSYLLILRGRDSEAIPLLNQLIEFYCKEEKSSVRIPLADAYGLLGVAYRNTTEFDNALNAFSNALTLLSNPLKKHENINYSHPEYLEKNEFNRNVFNMAITYHDIGDYDKALEYYRLFVNEAKAISKDPIVSGLLNMCYKFRNLVVQVLEKNLIISKSKHIDHIYMEAHAIGNIGLILLEQKNLDSAIESLMIALNISEQTIDIHGQRLWNYHIGIAYEEKGELEIAYQYYQKSLELLELLRTELKSNDFLTAFDLFERGFRSRYFSGWTPSHSNWASIERFSAIPKVPRTMALFHNLQENF